MPTAIASKFRWFWSLSCKIKLARVLIIIVKKYITRDNSYKSNPPNTQVPTQPAKTYLTHTHTSKIIHYYFLLHERYTHMYEKMQEVG